VALSSIPEDSRRVLARFRRLQVLVTALVVLGLVVWGAGQEALRWRGAPSGRAWLEAGLAGMLFHLGACVLFVRLKGRSPWLGVIGLLGIVGVFILFFLENDCHRCGRREKKSCRECPSCGAPM
jgi:hypothetical protein